MLDFLKHLFSPDTAARPTDWQPLHRTAAQERSRARWLEQQVYLNWAGPYFKAYHYSKASITGQQFRVQLLEEAGRHGAVLLYDPSIGPGNFRHFFDLLRDRVQALGYNVSASDHRTQHHERYSETVEKHFLKPLPNDCTATGLCNQRYGNVMLDLVRVNGQPGFIRFVSNPYQDTFFTPPHSFDELMAAVLDMPPAPPEVQALIKEYWKE